jgi:hypothetical protein
MQTKIVPITLNNPHNGQQKILNGLKRFNVVACGRRFGKSALATNLLAKPALSGFPVAYFTPTYKLLEPTFNELISILGPAIKRSHLNNKIELNTGGNIDFWSLENPLAGRSRKYKRAVVDEAAFVKDLKTSWDEAIRPTLTDFKGDGFFFSTPKGKNDFYKYFNRGKIGEANWASFQMSTYENPFIDPNELDDVKKEIPSIAFSQEYLAEFNENIANPFGITEINQCIYQISNNPAVCFGIDLAKSFDYTVVIGLDINRNVCYFDRWQSDWRTTIQKILSLPNAPIKIDSTGVGDPIVEEVQRTRNAEGFKFTATSKQQLMEGLAMSIQKRRISFPKGFISDELKDFEYHYTRTGVKYSAPNGLRDDCVCALALADSAYSVSSTDGNYCVV